jgi:hypothetical protein
MLSEAIKRVLLLKMGLGAQPDIFQCFISPYKQSNNFWQLHIRGFRAFIANTFVDNDFL